MRKGESYHDSIASQLAHGCSARTSVVGPSANLLIRAQTVHAGMNYSIVSARSSQDPVSYSWKRKSNL